MSSPEKLTFDGRRGGFALVLVLFVMMVTAALIAASVTLGANHLLVNRYHSRNDRLNSVADAGLEEARAKLNGNAGLYPASGYTTLESNAAADDGQGNAIPGVTRSLYAGPVGIISGEYGVIGVVVAVAKDAGGAIAVRRLMVNQESFAKFAYFTDVEPSNISFGGGDQIFGPVHTNDYLKIYSSGATFHDETRTAKTVQGAQYGVFKKGYVENATPIPMPATADLTKLKTQAQAGQTAIVSTTSANVGEATTRIEFVTVDINGDGDTSDENEGFFKVFQSNDRAWVSGDLPAGGWSASANCGHVDAGQFKMAKQHTAAQNNANTDDWADALSSGTRRCYLGGASELNEPDGFRANTGGEAAPATLPAGSWLAWPGTVSALIPALGTNPGGGTTDRNYLWPISRSMNPNFKGVIYVDGDVVISGRLRGKVTLAATGQIIIGDDLTYVTDPGLGTCADLMGIFSGTDVLMADNFINSPGQALAAANNNQTTWYTFDDTSDEFVHGIVLALSNFTVEDYDQGAVAAQPCAGANWGRGCLYLSGGIIQNTRGAVGTIIGGGVAGTGYVKRYSYDKCAAKEPPPYFPTTGHFIRAQDYPVDPTGFNIGAYFTELQNP